MTVIITHSILEYYKSKESIIIKWKRKMIRGWMEEIR